MSGYQRFLCCAYLWDVPTPQQRITPMTAIDTDFAIAATPAKGMIARLLQAARGLFAGREDHIDTAERRAFVQEMLDRNPDAFASDFDVQSMMQHFPNHF